MRILQTMLAVAALAIAGASLHAQVDETTGVKGLQADGGTFQWSVVVDFGSTAHAEDFNITLTTSVTGYFVKMVDCTAAARATTFTEWTAANHEWDEPGLPAGTYTLTIGGGPYTTMSMSGVHRFFFDVTNPNPGPPTSGDFTLELDNGSATTATTVQTSFPVPTHNPNPAPPNPWEPIAISGTSSKAAIWHDVQQARGLAEIGAAADAIKFDFGNFGFPNGGEALDVSLHAKIEQVSTEIEFEIYLLAEDGGSTPSHTLSLSGTANWFDVTQYTTGILSGSQHFRLVVKAGATFSGPTDVEFFLTWSHRVNMPGVPPEPAKVVEPPVSITPAGSLLVGSPHTLTGDGGSQNPVSFTWSLEGTVPVGVSLSATSGASTELQFTVNTPTNAQATVRCASVVGEWVEETYTLDFTGANILHISAPNDLSDGIESAAYIGATMQATSGQAPYSWDDGGTLPAGLSIDAGTGDISGSPDPGTAGTHTVTITVTDGNLDTADRTYSLEIFAAGTMTITTTSLPPGTEGSGYGPISIEVSPPSSGYNWSATGLPSGLTFDNNTGTISGTLATGTAGDHTVTVTVSDSASSDNATFTLTVDFPPINNSGSPGGGGGCTATGSTASWLVLIALLGMVAARVRLRRE